MNKSLVVQILANTGQYQINISHFNVYTEVIVQSNNLSF